jgi:cytochrome c oxidase subunit 2
MKRTRLGLTALFGAVLLAALTDPALAQSTADSTTEELIWGLNSWLLYLAVPIAVLVEGILIYTIWKYRKQEEPQPTRENRRLEIVWTVATAIVLLAVGIGSYTVMASPYITGTEAGDLDAAEDPIEVKVVGQRYSWTFEYPNETVEKVTGSSTQVTSSGTLVLPTDRAVQLNVTATDWLHSFHVPELALKQDAFPGQWQSILTKVHSTGKYQLYCAEYCGSGHSQMLGTVDVRSEQAFEDWLAEQAG